MSNSVWPRRWQSTRLPHPWDSPGKNTGVGCHFLLQCMKVKSEREVTQSCLTLSDPMDCSPPGSSIHGIFQARVLEWGAIAFSEWKVEAYLKNERTEGKGWRRGSLKFRKAESESLVLAEEGGLAHELESSCSWMSLLWRIDLTYLSSLSLDIKHHPDTNSRCWGAVLTRQSSNSQLASIIDVPPF